METLSVERKLVAILAADVVGYSRLMSEREEATLANLHLCQIIFSECIQNHDGRVFGGAGDSIIAEFQSSVKALHCAIEIQQRLRGRNDNVTANEKMHFRIGINVGDVVIEGNNLMGDGVNIAARLEGLADPGGICISADVYHQVRNKLDIEFESLGKQKLKNIPDPVEVYRGIIETSGTGTAQRKFKTSKIRNWTLMTGVFGVLVLSIAVWFQTTSEISVTPATQTAAHKPTQFPSIVVLPFNNKSSDPDQGYFVDGITEDIITDLSRLSNLVVLASNTSFKYKGTNAQPQRVGRELAVNYVLDGSVRKSGQQLRITAQLVKVEDGSNIWAARYDRELADVFALQDEVTRKIVMALSLNLTDIEKEGLGHSGTDNHLAYDAFLEGRRLSRQLTRQSHEQARTAFQQSIALDPSYARPYGGIAFTLGQDYRFGWSDTPIETLDRALVIAQKAVSLGYNIPQTYWVLGYIHMMRREYIKAERAITQAIDIAPNYADGYGLLALIYNNLGRSTDAIEQIAKGMRLNPFYTWEYPYNLGRSYYQLGQIEQAITVLEEAQTRNENALPIKLFLATSYIRAGRVDDADWIVGEIQVMNPAATVSHTEKTIPISDLKLQNTFLNDLRRAGLPE